MDEIKSGSSTTKYTEHTKAETSEPVALFSNRVNDRRAESHSFFVSVALLSRRLFSGRGDFVPHSSTAETRSSAEVPGR